ncbi:hypothetical protein [Lapidilactobacillus salsurivasis]
MSVQTAVKTLSGWSGEIRGEIAVKLVLVALPLRPRLSFEIRGFCEAQSDAHSELTPNFAAQAAAKLLLPARYRKSEQRELILIWQVIQDTIGAQVIDQCFGNFPPGR